MAWNKRYNVKYDINPWMTSNINHVNNELAYQQWLTLATKLTNITQDSDIDIIQVDNDSIPDIVFTANSCFLNEQNKLIVLSNFKYSERKLEVPIFYSWFKEQFPDYLIVEIDEAFEGAGDVLIDAYNNIWAGYGFRSSLESHCVLQNFCLNQDVFSLKLINPSFYHLDTCFCPLKSGHILFYPDAFTESCNIKISQIFGDKLIKVDTNDAYNFACNAVELNQFIIMNKCSESLAIKLEHAGYFVIETPLSEFLKSGGSAKCLTLKIPI